MFDDLTRTRCCNCGILFGLDTGHYKQLLEAGGKMAFHCPNGHKQWFTEGEADKLRRERDRLAQQVAQKNDEIARQKAMRETAERQVSAAKGQITKLKKRAKAGTCPCCNRTFSNMAAHMKTKHPEFDPKVVDLGAEKAKRA